MAGPPARTTRRHLRSYERLRHPSQPPAANQESEDLENALSEAGSSPIEYLRAIDKHLAKYPDSPRKAELERAAVRAAMEANDDLRIVEYGERVLARAGEEVQYAGH